MKLKWLLHLRFLQPAFLQSEGRSIPEVVLPLFQSVFHDFLLRRFSLSLQEGVSVERCLQVVLQAFHRAVQGYAYTDTCTCMWKLPVLV